MWGEEDGSVDEEGLERGGGEGESMEGGEDGPEVEGGEEVAARGGRVVDGEVEGEKAGLLT